MDRVYEGFTTAVQLQIDRSTRRSLKARLFGFYPLVSLLLISLVSCSRTCIFEEVRTSTTGRLITSTGESDIAFEGRVTETNISPVEYFQIRDDLITSGKFAGTIFTIESSIGFIAFELAEKSKSDTLKGVESSRFGGWGKSPARVRKGTVLLFGASQTEEFILTPDSTQTIVVLQEAPLILQLNLTFTRPDGAIIRLDDTMEFSLYAEERDCD